MGMGTDSFFLNSAVRQQHTGRLAERAGQGLQR
jgi:hypothetical protein